MSDILIIGAGIVGCACAAALSAQGLRVTIVEASTVGGGASAAGMGHLVVMDDNPDELALTKYSLQLWRNLVKENQAAHEFTQCGTIWVAADEEELAAAESKYQTLQQQGVSCEMLNASALYQAEPALRKGLAGGILVQQDGLAYSPKSTQILLNQALALGATLVRGTVIRLKTNGVVLADGQQLSAAKVVLANGIAASDLLPELALRYKKGHLIITDRYPQIIRHQLVELGYIKSAHASEGESVAFNLQPRPTGQILIGSSRQFDIKDKAIEPRILAKMLNRAVSYLPQLADLKAIRSWTGFRAATPDGFPVIGEHPSRSDIWLATGHEGLGITTSLATAQILTAQICNLPCEISYDAYLPTRACLGLV